MTLNPPTTSAWKETGFRVEGRGGELSAGIALLFVQKSGIENNVIGFAFGPGILLKDAGPNPGNWASGNRLTGNGVSQKLPAIVLQGSASARVEDNQILPSPSH